ncbi:MAG: 3-hydroxybutyryl-CoA dehydrogenase, partial [Geminicoccaceae bacterium]|nr:3-hydroxybutyryl-CoA dehydrogenase [Geminicoccaceae bacterium]
MTYRFDKDYPPLPEFRRIGVIGAGQMGAGIAQVAATSGLNVTMMDVSAEQLSAARERMGKLLGRQVTKGAMSEVEKGEALGRIETCSDLSGLKACDLVIEAATENEELKRKIFTDLLPHLKSDAVIASNTSSISITRLGAITDRPGRFIGMHFMNPVPAMKLVEIIRGIATDEDTYQAVRDLSIKMGKTPVTAEDFPAFIVNR